MAKGKSWRSLDLSQGQTHGNIVTSAQANQSCQRQDFKENRSSSEPAHKNGLIVPRKDYPGPGIVVNRPSRTTTPEPTTDRHCCTTTYSAATGVSTTTEVRTSRSKLKNSVNCVAHGVIILFSLYILYFLSFKLLTEQIPMLRMARHFCRAGYFVRNLPKKPSMQFPNALLAPRSPCVSAVYTDDLAARACAMYFKSLSAIVYLPVNQIVI